MGSEDTKREEEEWEYNKIKKGARGNEELSREKKTVEKKRICK